MMSQRKSMKQKVVGTAATTTTTTTTTTDKWTGRIQKTTTNMLSCLSVKTVDESAHSGNTSKSKRPSLAEIEMPSQDEMNEWTKSFEKVMSHKVGRQIFKEFLKSEYSEENMLFWLACEELKKETHPDVVEEKARLIYDDYISILSPKEVSLDAQVREIINKKMIEPSRSTFDEAQVQIFTLMQRDSYPRFLNSIIFKRLLQSHSTS